MTADGLDELVEGSGTDAFEVGLEPREGHPDGVEVGTAGGQEQKPIAMGLEPPGSAVHRARDHPRDHPGCHDAVP